MHAVDLLDEIRRMIAAYARPDLQTSIDGLLLSRVATQETDYSMTDPLLVVMAQGGKRLLLGEEVFEYRAGQVLVVTTGLPVTGHFLGATPQTPALGMGLVLRPATIAELLLESPPQRWSRTHAGPAIATGDAGPELLDAAARLLRLLDHPADARVLAPLVEREILWRLLTGPHARSSARSGSPTATRPRSAGRSGGSATTTPSRCGSRTSRGWPG